jgi:hypothetical protein
MAWQLRPSRPPAFATTRIATARFAGTIERPMPATPDELFADLDTLRACGVLMTTRLRIFTFSRRKKFVFRHLDRNHSRRGKVPAADAPVASAQLCNEQGKIHMKTNSPTHVRELTDKEVASVAGGVIGAIPGVTDHAQLPAGLFVSGSTCSWHNTTPSGNISLAPTGYGICQNDYTWF